jgi:hypothetical protein
MLLALEEQVPVVRGAVLASEPFKLVGVAVGLPVKLIEQFFQGEAAILGAKDSEPG